MTGIYWTPDEAQLKAFSSSSKSTTKGVETLIKIEISVKDPWAISSILRQLDEVSREQTSVKPATQKTPTTKTKPLALPAPLLQLPYLGDEK
ncbi:hypothetical protein HB780_05575 (plasmid) [Rhizobium lusitanum]|uniref:hypothetical protein n=1 Tax=Rhizobium lusitanum TaxID=293958 RepID=UPI00160B1451|nr:hypothetical protein [Rhizobium lusitanum]QND45225.1 hypothetical protein HB780_05575 [Rhizobium lusitanum]